MADLHNTIHLEDAYEKDARAYYPVLIVGAGAAGIGMGCQLKQQLGFDQFRIFDRQAGLGGTWWINRYPGVAVDIPASFYSFSFAPNSKWTTFFPPGREIVQYFHYVCDKYQIVDKFQFNTDVTEVKWLESEKVWEVTLVHLAVGTGDLSTYDRKKLAEEHGERSVYLRTEKVRAKIVVSCVGGLVEPRDWPDNIPGRDQFEGDIFHSARWNYNVDLTGKDVIVLGTGCSAAQFTTLLPKAPYHAKSVTHLMRSPPWVIPRLVPPGGPDAWSKWSPILFEHVPGLGLFFRFFLFLMGELDYFTIFQNKPFNVKARRKIENNLVKHLEKTVPKKYHEILTPDYGVGCKRRIFDAHWFRSMDDPSYNLTTQPLTKVHAKSVTIGPGRTYPPLSKADSKAPTDEVTLSADTIILANGFDTTTWLHPLKVRGRSGKLLQDVWDERGGAQAYMGIAMDDCPNFFIVFGPNTATGHSSVILAIENTINYSLKFIGPLLSGEAEIAEVKESAEKAWTKSIQAELKDTVFMSGGCRSWYFTESGWNATAYPRSQIDFSLRCMFPRWSDWNVAYTRKGVLRQKVRKAVLLAVLFGAFTATLVGAYWSRQQGGSVMGLPREMMQSLLTLLRRGLDTVQELVSA